MREIFTSGSVGGAPGNRCFYPDISSNSDLQITYPCRTVGVQEEAKSEADQNERVVVNLTLGLPFEGWVLLQLI